MRRFARAFGRNLLHVDRHLWWLTADEVNDAASIASVVYVTLIDPVTSIPSIIMYR